MIKIGNDNNVFIDIDSTLIFWSKVPEEYFQNILNINGVVFYYNHHTLSQIKEHKKRMHTVILWSLGGVNWAHQVADALNLYDEVDAVMAKPKWIIDDKQPEEWMPKAKYYGYREPHWEDK